MRCGLCLPVCPTFTLVPVERATPRGRLALMRAVSEGRLELSDGFGEAMTFCLGCLACQTACPAGVPYGNLLELARGQVEERQSELRHPLVSYFRKWLLEHILYSPNGLEPIKPLIRLYQRSGLARMNLARLIPGHLGSWERLLPTVPSKSIHQEINGFLPAKPPVRGRVGLLTGCLENVLLADMGMASARVLACNGFEILAPVEQVCCGALPAHIGEVELARRQARRNIDVFEAAEVDWVVSDAAGCSAQLKSYGELLAGDVEYAQRAKRFSGMVKDATQLMAEYLPLRGKLNALDFRVAYDDPCHLIHGQGISVQPRELILQIPGIELLELPEAAWCCGSAGTYNLTHVEELETLLRRKMEHVRNIAPQVLATANTGCYIQLNKGLHDAGLDVRVMHVMELIDMAYQ